MESEEERISTLGWKNEEENVELEGEEEARKEIGISIVCGGECRGLGAGRRTLGCIIGGGESADERDDEEEAEEGETEVAVPAGPIFE